MSYLARKTPTYRLPVESARQNASDALDRLASDGIGDSYEEGNRSAHWWVGYLSATLETLLASTAPEVKL